MEIMKKKVGLTMISILTTLVILSLASPAMAVTSSKTYTLNADFDEGTFVGLEHSTVPDQLQISKDVTTFPFMWIANSGEDTLSKWDTNTNKELARYNTWFGAPANHDAYTGPAPSRTCVDSQGNCYVANRHFDGRPADVIKILNNEYIDRNHNGVLDTSYDKNGDGTITSDEMLPMNDTNGNGKIDDNEIQDERVAWAVSVGPNNGLGRSLAIDRDGNIWVGLYNSKLYYELSSVDGHIIAGPIDVSPNTPYGAAVDKYGVLWGASLGNNLLRLDTNTKQVNLYDHSAFGADYGIALGYDDNGNTIVYQADYSGKSYIRFNSSSKTFSTPAASKFQCLGVATDSKGNIFCSNEYTGAVTKFAPDGSVIWSAAPQINSEARGTVVDSNGDVWIVHRTANKLSKFNGTDGKPLGVFITGIEPYTYSDATGLSLRNSIGPLGTWTVVFDSEADNMQWGTVSWNSNEPTGTAVKVEVRSSSDKNTWSPWETATNGVSLNSTHKGRYLQVQTTLQSNGDVSPILYDLTVKGGNQPPVANAGPDQTVNQTNPAGALVTLNGSNSTDDGKISPLTYNWTWNGGSASSVSPTTTLPVGTTTVTLTINDGEFSSTDTVNITVVPLNVNNPPVANAGPDQTVKQTNTAGAAVTLNGSGSTDDGKISPLTYNWTWNGGSASGVSPTITLPVGTTTVTLTVNDGEFSSTDTVKITVTSSCVPKPKLPKAAFSASLISGKAPLKVTFTDKSTGGKPDSWYWNFGDKIYSKHDQTATHTFTKAGKYTVSLTVKNAAGSSTKTITKYVTVK